MVICYTVSEMWPITNVIVIFHFGLFFGLLQSEKKNKKIKTKQNKKKKKNEKNAWRYHNFTIVYRKS